MSDRRPVDGADVRRDEVVGRPVHDLHTPALLLDADVVERNLVAMAVDCQALGVALRPHVKAHKTSIIARRQVELGAVGVTCAKLGEADVIAAAGVGEILVSTVIGSPRKAERLAGLAVRAPVIAVVDSVDAASWLATAARAHGVVVDVLVDVDVGQRRTGVEPEQAGLLARSILELGGLRLRGIQAYEGHLQHIRDATARAAEVTAATAAIATARTGVEQAMGPIEIVSTAGTGTYRSAGRQAVATEVQPGSYVTMDSDYAAVDDVPYEPALTVLATVIGSYRDWAVVDVGNKAISTDAGQPVPRSAPGLAFGTAGDEHGKLRADGPDVALPAIGTPLELVPSHCDTTVNLYDAFHVIRDGVVVDVWPIEARGRTQ